MRTFLLLGITGSGKSSFVNSTFGIQLAETNAYQACTKVVKYFSRNTPWGDICLIDTPGMAEGEEESDGAYLSLIRKEVNLSEIDSLLYISRLNETRFRAEEKITPSSISSRIRTPYMV